MAKEPKNYDKEDVEFALSRVTQDGSGLKAGEEPPVSDFDEEDDKS